MEVKSHGMGLAAICLLTWEGQRTIKRAGPSREPHRGPGVREPYHDSSFHAAWTFPALT